MPPHIAAGYEKLRGAGLVCLTLSPDYGGYGLPFLLNCAYLEMVARADSSLMTIVGLQAGVAQRHREVRQRRDQAALPAALRQRRVAGRMDLTEPQAGSDLGGILTRATPRATATSSTARRSSSPTAAPTIHLVLARDAATFDQSKGTTNGLSLILCPTTLPDGRRNAVRVTRVESKLGIHGSPTCVVEFDHAEGFLLGERGQGFRAMLDLMNNARLGVAAQAIGIAEAAFREAREYAAQRVQFGAPIIAAAAGQVDAHADGDPHPGGARAALPHLRADRPDRRAAAATSPRRAASTMPRRAALQASYERNTAADPLPHAALQVLRDRDQQRA